MSTRENSFKKDYRFDKAEDLRNRYQMIADKDPLKKMRKNLIESYDKLPMLNPRTKKYEPNHGQLRMKVDNHQALFVDFLTESPERFKVNCLHSDPLNKDQWGRVIASNFKDIFLKSWECMFVEESSTIFDMCMFSKGIMYWDNKVGYEPENIPVSDVFPNLEAKMNSETWELLFVRKSMTIIELYNLVFGDNKKTNTTKGWREAGIKSLLENPVASGASSETYLSKFNAGSISQSEMDTQIVLLFCYVKEYKKDSNGNRVSKYVIPEDAKYYPSVGQNKNPDNFLFVDNSYCKYISNVACTRSYSVTRSFWDAPSYAELMYLSCKLYDQTTNAIIRAVIRNMTLFLKADDDAQSDKLRTIGMSEVETLDSGTELVQSQVRIPVAEATQMIRQIMFDVEKEQAAGQAAGSQNTKGYAITAKEAELRSLNEDKAEAGLIKSFTAIDRFFYKELYRRAVTKPSSEEKKLNDLFKKRMEFHKIPPEAYDPENVIIEPIFSFGGSRANKISFSQSLYGAVSINASSESQKKAKRIAVAAHVGEENADEFFNAMEEQKNLLEVQQKAGSENEDLDNPAVNPVNVPVSKDDNHMLEVVFHIQDYEYKLNTAMKLIQTAQQLPPMMKIGMLMTGKDLIIAQDSKGAHIEAHFAFIGQDPTIDKNQANQIYSKFNEMRKSQDELTAQVDKIFQEYIDSNQEDITLTTLQRHTQAMNQIELDKAQKLHDIGLAKALEQKDLAATKAASKTAQDHAHKQVIGDLEASQKATQVELEKQKAAIKTLT